MTTQELLEYAHYLSERYDEDVEHVVIIKENAFLAKVVYDNMPEIYKKEMAGHAIAPESVVSRVAEIVEFYENRELMDRNMPVVECEIESYWEQNSETATEMD